MSKIGSHYCRLWCFDYFFPSRLYPGVAGPSGPAIGAGWKPEALREPLDVEGINPEDENSDNGTTYKGAKPVKGNLASRAPRVVGSFDHPMLPMPPVSHHVFVNIRAQDCYRGGR
jgi:hypothetical protein